MSRGVDVVPATAAPVTGALSLSSGALSDTSQIAEIFIHLSAAAASPGSLTITLDSHLGSAYDTVLDTVDMVATAATDIFWQPDHSFRLVSGDAVVVAYANPDGRTIGASIYIDRNATE